LKYRNVDVDVKKKSHNIIILSATTYTSNSWTLRKMNETKINTAEIKHFRRIVGETK